MGIVVLACGGGRAAAPLKKSQVVCTSKYLRARQVKLEVQLGTHEGGGTYTVVGSTFEPGQP